MSLSRSSALASGRASIAAALIVILPIGLGGCATSEARSYEPASRVSASPAYVAGPFEAGVEIEDDGIPVQPPPVANRSHEPDDPREPFSPNYGRSPPETIDRAADRLVPAQRTQTSLGF